jgi:hypothetical protein
MSNDKAPMPNQAQDLKQCQMTKLNPQEMPNDKAHLSNDK